MSFTFTPSNSNLTGAVSQSYYLLIVNLIVLSLVSSMKIICFSSWLLFSNNGTKLEAKVPTDSSYLYQQTIVKLLAIL